MSIKKNALTAGLSKPGANIGAGQSLIDNEPILKKVSELTGIEWKLLQPVAPSSLVENSENPFTSLDDDEFENLKKDIEKNGVLVPLLVNGKTVIDGHNRLKAAIELELKAIPIRQPVKTMTPGEVRELAFRLQVNRRNLTPKELAAVLAKTYPEAFNNTGKGRKKNETVSLLEIAEIIGKTERQVQNLKELHLAAKENAGGNEPGPVDYQTAAEKINEKRRANSQKPKGEPKPDKVDQKPTETPPQATDATSQSGGEDKPPEPQGNPTRHDAELLAITRKVEAGEIKEYDLEKIGLAAKELLDAVLKIADSKTKKKIQGGKK
jgi:ParB-like chromosome segregation protein Spo0J